MLTRPTINGSTIAFVLSGALSLLVYWQLASMGASRMSAGRVEEAGVDLMQSPELQHYMMDYIYICSATHVIAGYSARAWLLFLLVSTRSFVDGMDEMDCEKLTFIVPGVWSL